MVAFVVHAQGRIERISLFVRRGGGQGGWVVGARRLVL